MIIIEPKCFYCNDVIYNPKSVTVDHVIPRRRMGRDRPSNLVVACKSCNSKKGTRSVRWFLFVVMACESKYNVGRARVLALGSHCGLTHDEKEQRVFWFKARVQIESKHYECIRVDGRQLCRWCHKPYNDHPRPEPEVVPTLHVDCEGRMLKT